MQRFKFNQPDEDSMERILEGHSHDLAGIVLCLAWREGLRRSEISNLTWDRVDLDGGLLRLPDREVPLEEASAGLLREWKARCSAYSEYVAMNHGTRARMGEESLSALARRVLNEGGQEDVRLQDLRYDYALRRVRERGWAYASRVTGIGIRQLQLRFAGTLPETASARARPERQPLSDPANEEKLLRVLKAEQDTAAGLALALSWYMGLSSAEIVALRWEQIDGELAHLRRAEGAEAEIPAPVRDILAARRRKCGADGPVLLTDVSRTPVGTARLPKLVRAALVQGGLEDTTLQDVRALHDRRVQEEAVLRCAEERGAVTRQELQQRLGLTQNGAWQLLRGMAEEGALTKVGSRYYISGTVTPPERQRAAVIGHLERIGTTTRQDVAELLGIGPRQAALLLGKMVAEGTVECYGQRYYLKQFK